MKIAIGLILGVAIGVVCRLVDLPLPAPPVLTGALLVVAMTVGYLAIDRWFDRKCTTEPLCGGPTGKEAPGHD